MIEIICHRRNDIKSLLSTPIEYGVEIDLRTHNNKLVINHDPFKGGVSFEEWISLYNHGTLILNVKEDGLEEKIISLLHKNNISSFFFLDQAFPTIIKMIKNGESRCALRISEYESVENVLKLSNKLDWVWLDIFTKFPITFEEYLIIKKANFKICLVSPELQGLENMNIRSLKDFLISKGIKVDAVCTKYPEKWENF